MNTTEQGLQQAKEELEQRVRERTHLASLLLQRARMDGGKSLEASLAAELYKDSLDTRQQAFKGRLFDRTVHPTQMYSLQVEVLWDEAVRILLRGGGFPQGFAAALASALFDEYLGLNVAVTSQQEGAELLLDMNALLAAAERQADRTRYEAEFRYAAHDTGVVRCASPCRPAR